MYLKPISGGYVLLAQSLGRSPITLFAKYDWYDPNTALRRNDIGRTHSTEADIAYQTLGLGARYQCSKAISITLYAEQTTNEKTHQLARFSQDREDNRLTLALLYRF